MLQGEYQAVVGQLNSVTEQLNSVTEQLNKRLGLRGGSLEILRSIRRRMMSALGIGTRIFRRLFFLPEAAVTTGNFPLPWKPLATPQPIVDGQLRVLVLSHMFPHPNQPGSGSFVFEQVKTLREHTHIDVRVLSGQPDWIFSRNPIRFLMGLMAHNEKFNSSRWWNLFGVPTKYIPYRILAPFWSYGWMYRFAMIRAIKSLRVEFPFDLVHAHTGYLDGSAGQVIARRFGVPLVITEHTGPFSMLTSNPIVKHDTLRSLYVAARVIAVSEAQKRNVAVHVSPKNHENIRVIPNGVDTSVFFPSEQWDPNPLAPRILFVGYFEPVKNIPLLLEAFTLVRHELNEAQLTLVGGGSVQQMIEINKLVDQMGLNQIVTVIGYKSRDEIARVMREECDMLVLSSHAETFGVVLIEALASGRPVVATRCGGPEDIVNDPALGELCPPDDAQALAVAILRVSHCLPQYNPVQIRENAVKRFAIERIAEAIHNEYADVLGSVDNYIL
jgi:glycosyltransferase involved in cell wall biosynthesis